MGAQQLTPAIVGTLRDEVINTLEHRSSASQSSGHCSVRVYSIVLGRPLSGHPFLQRHLDFCVHGTLY